MLSCERIVRALQMASGPSTLLGVGRPVQGVDGSVKIQSLIPGHEIKLVGDTMHFVGSGRELLIQNPDTPYIVPQRHRHFLFPPNNNSGVIAATSFSGQQVLYQLIPAMLKSRIRHSQLETLFTETGGTNSVTPAIAPYAMCSQVVVGLNGQSQGRDQTTYSLAILFYLMFRTWEDLTLVNFSNRRMMNMSVSTFVNGETAIGPGGQRLMVLPLEFCIINQLNLFSIRANVWLQQWLPTANPTIAGTGSLGIAQQQLRVLCEYSDPIDNALAAALSAKPLLVNFCHNYIFSIQQQLTAGQQTIVQLTGLNSAISATDIIILQPAGSAQQFAARGMYTFQELGGTSGDASYNGSSGFDIQTADGTSVVSGNQNSQPYWLRAQMPGYTNSPGYLTSRVPIYPVFYGDNQGPDKKDMFHRYGLLMGVYQHQDSDKLVINCSPTFPSGQYFVTLLSLGFSTFLQQDGMFSTSRGGQYNS